MDWVTLNNITRELTARMADASVRAVVLAALALLVIPFLRRSSTAQHAVWTLVLAGMLVLPFLRTVVPVTHVPLPQALTPQFTQAKPVPPSSVPPRITPSPAETPLPASPLWPLFVIGSVFGWRAAIRNAPVGWCADDAAGVAKHSCDSFGTLGAL